MQERSRSGRGPRAARTSSNITMLTLGASSASRTCSGTGKGSNPEPSRLLTTIAIGSVNLRGVCGSPNLVAHMTSYANGEKLPSQSVASPDPKGARTSEAAGRVPAEGPVIGGPPGGHQATEIDESLTTMLETIETQTGELGHDPAHRDRRCAFGPSGPRRGSENFQTTL